MTPRTQGRSIHLIIVFLISSITQEHPTKKHVAWCLESPEQSFCVLCMELEHITLLAHKCVHQQASPLNWKSRVFISISFYHLNTRSDQITSVAQLCPTLCDPMNRSTPGLPVHHQLPEFTQTHVHQVSDAIQPSRSLSSPSPPAPNPSQHQSLFQWVNSLHEVAKVLEFQV